MLSLQWIAICGAVCQQAAERGERRIWLHLQGKEEPMIGTPAGTSRDCTAVEKNEAGRLGSSGPFDRMSFARCFLHGKAPLGIGVDSSVLYESIASQLQSPPAKITRSAEGIWTTAQAVQQAMLLLVEQLLRVPPLLWSRLPSIWYGSLRQASASAHSQCTRRCLLKPCVLRQKGKLVESFACFA